MTKVDICKYWVAPKQRFCKFPVVSSTGGFCSIHDIGSGDKERIPCPFDSRHMIYKKDLESHSRKCSKVSQDFFADNQPLLNRGCNRAPSSDTVVLLNDGCEVTDTLESELTAWKERLGQARTKLEAMLRARFPQVQIDKESSLFVPAWTDEVERCVRTMTGKTSETRRDIDKHNFQNASLLQLLSTRELLPSRLTPRLYVELGCGKAGLTRWLMHSLGLEGKVDSSVFLLLDYEARRNKQENKKDLRDKISSDSVVRLRSNITDVDLGEFLKFKNLSHPSNPSPVGKPGSIERRIFELHAKVAQIQARPDWPLPSVVGVAKHLCGAATDYGLRSLVNISSHNPSIVFATCCHHKCEWRELVGLESLVEVGVTEADFERMKTMAGWATTEGVSEQKRLIGRLVKSLIDLVRIHWLIDNLPSAQSVSYCKYIEECVTPENFAIVVKTS